MKVLFATDYSHGAGVARQLLASLEWPKGTVIRVVTAYEPLGLFADELLASRMRELEAELSEETASLAGPGRVLESAVLVGRPATLIVDEARRVGADLVVVGSRGQGPLATALLGSVAAEVVDHAPSPVLVARRPAVDRLVFCEDGSVGAREAGRLIAHWPIFAGRPTRVVSVSPLPAPFLAGSSPSVHAFAVLKRHEGIARARHEHRRLAEQGARHLATAGLPAGPDVREGDPAEQILAAATKSRADLIVVGSRGMRGVARLLVGSVARKVLPTPRAPCSSCRTASRRCLAR